MINTGRGWLTIKSYFILPQFCIKSTGKIGLKTNLHYFVLKENKIKRHSKQLSEFDGTKVYFKQKKYFWCKIYMAGIEGEEKQQILEIIGFKQSSSHSDIWAFR